jgi:L-lactate dehydrogenase complex protein LldF
MTTGTPRAPETTGTPRAPGKTVSPLPLAERARAAIADADLQRALGNVTALLARGGQVARTDPGLVEARRRAAAIRREVFSDLDGWLDRLESKLVSIGVTVHRAADPEDARRTVVAIARSEGVRLAVKSKSMATEEIHLNDALEAAGVEVVETDLGEYIIQLAREAPSHIIAPAIHKNVPQVARLFSHVAGAPLPDDRTVLCAFARERLREKFLRADMGITGANFVAADTGTIVLVTNEGNGRMCTSLPRLHVAVVPVEKVVPRLADLGVVLPVLTRAATGQALSTYVSMVTGPRRPGELDGPERLHVVLLDHNRRSLVGTPYEDMLACVRCGACLNVCPVYRRIGGHAYSSVYSGPMGAVLTPLLSGGEEGRDLPEASSLCGACTEACPVGIPLADLLVRLRADLRRPGPPVPLWPTSAPSGGDGDRVLPLSLRRTGFGAWARIWASPAGYRLSTAAARRLSRLLGPRSARRAPLLRGWAADRDVPLPARRSFRERWTQRKEEGW